MVGEEVVKHSIDVNALQDGEGENGPLKSKGFIKAHPHQWQPIETAPKDARILLLTGRQEVSIGKWLDNSKAQWPWSGWSTDLGPSARATHWMPLPAPPVLP